MRTQVKRTIQVWEIPIRFFHLAFAVSIIGALVSTLRENWLVYHAGFGMTAFILVVFRIGWGFIGGRHSRFSSFVRSPAQVVRYVLDQIRAAKQKEKPEEGIGHNPLAGLVMIFMLLAVVVLGVSGMTVLGGQEQIAPWAAWSGYSAAQFTIGIHKTLALVMIGLIAAHLLGIVLHTRRTGEMVALAMVDGRRHGTAQTKAPATSPATGKLRLALSVGSLALAGLLFSTLPFQYTGRQTLQALALHELGPTQ